MSVQEIRDNLTIGITLSDGYKYGLELDQLLIVALGYTPGAPWPIGDREHYISRLRTAQHIGERKYALREAGYFTINAMPFGNLFIYKAVWYTWLNPAVGKTCTVPVCFTDLTPMRRWRDRYLETRTRSTRSVRAADNLIRQEKALTKGDRKEVKQIQHGMVEDGTLGEIVTGLLGVPYVEVPNMLNELSKGNPYGSANFNFSRQAQKIMDLEQRLADEQAKVVQSLSNLISVRQNLPSNVGQLVLQDARDRLANLS